MIISLYGFFDLFQMCLLYFDNLIFLPFTPILTKCNF